MAWRAILWKLQVMEEVADPTPTPAATKVASIEVTLALNLAVQLQRVQTTNRYLHRQKKDPPHHIMPIQSSYHHHCRLRYLCPPRAGSRIVPLLQPGEKNMKRKKHFSLVEIARSRDSSDHFLHINN